MIEVRNVSRSAVDRWFRVVRVPFDAAAQLLPRDRGPRNSALLFIDRADATARAAVGRLLRDDDLSEDATRRRIAADERARAVELRTRAEEAERVAEARLADELDTAERLRTRAEAEADARAREADERRSERERRAKQTEVAGGGGEEGEAGTARGAQRPDRGAGSRSRRAHRRRRGPALARRREHRQGAPQGDRVRRVSVSRHARHCSGGC
jgi:hypothetical protein